MALVQVRDSCEWVARIEGQLAEGDDPAEIAEGLADDVLRDVVRELIAHLAVTRTLDVPAPTEPPHIQPVGDDDELPDEEPEPEPPPRREPRPSAKWTGVRQTVAAAGDVFAEEVTVGKHQMQLGDLAEGHLLLLVRDHREQLAHHQSRAVAYTRLGLMLREKGYKTVRQLPRTDVEVVMNA